MSTAHEASSIIVIKHSCMHHIITFIRLLALTLNLRLIRVLNLIEINNIVLLELLFSFLFSRYSFSFLFFFLALLLKSLHFLYPNNLLLLGLLLYSELLLLLSSQLLLMLSKLFLSPLLLFLLGSLSSF